jgi:hypothetical protein
VPPTDSVIRSDFVCNDDTGGGTIQMGPAVAVAPTGGFSVVWYECRDGDADAWCQRFDVTGARLGINERLNTDATMGWQGDPAAAVSPNGRLLACWQDRRDIGNSDLFGQWLDSTGYRLGDNFRISDSAAAGDQGVSDCHLSPAGLALVAWDDRRNGLTGDIYAQLLDSDGVPLGDNFRVNDDGIGYANQYEPVVAGDDSGRFVVAWMDGRGRNSSDWNIFCQRYTAAGSALGSNIQVTTQDSIQWSPAVACAPLGRFVVAWEDRRLGGQSDIYAALYASNGEPVAGEFRVNDDVGLASQYGVSVAAGDQGEFLIAWTDLRSGDEDVYGRVLDRNGAPLGASFRIDDAPAGDQSAPSVVALPAGGFRVAWVDSRLGDSDVYCRAVGRSGFLGTSAVRVNDDWASSHQRVPSIAMDGRGQVFVGWEDERGRTADICGALFDSDGVPLGPNVRLNDDGAGTSAHYFTAVAGGIGRFIAAWTDFRVSAQNSDIFAQFLDGSGSPVGANFRVNQDVGSFQWYPYCAMDSSNRATVTWMDTRDGRYRVYYRRFDPQGVPIGGDSAVSDTVLEGAYASVAASRGGRFAVAWMENWGGDYDVFCQAFRGDGSRVGSGIRVNTDGLGVYQGYPACAVGEDGRFVVAWEDTRGGGYDVYLQWFDSAGSRLGVNERVSDDPSFTECYSPSCAFDLSGRLAVTFNDERDVPGNPQFYCQRYGIDRAAIGANQRVNEPNLFLKDHHWTVGQSVAASDSRVAFAWTGNRRHQGWDVVAKITDWHLIGTAERRVSAAVPGTATFAFRGAAIPVAAGGTVVDVLGRRPPGVSFFPGTEASVFRPASSGVFYVLAPGGSTRKLVVR